MDNSLLLAIGIIYASLNILAFGAFARDKIKAQTGGWRTPESMLLLLAMLGPFGALAAMNVFRHKTRHVKFYLVPVFALIHTGLIFWMWPRLFG